MCIKTKLHLLPTVGTIVFTGFAQTENLVTAALNGSDAARIFAVYHIHQSLRWNRMVFLYDFAMLDNVDGNVRVYFSKNFNSLWKFCPLNFDQVFPTAFAAADILQQSDRGRTIFQFQKLIQLQPLSSRNVI